MSEAIYKPTDLKCPWCGSPLRIVTWITGSFYGCSRYPKCNYHKNIKYQSPYIVKTKEINEVNENEEIASE